MGSLDYFEISEEEALDLALKNKGTVEIVMEDEESDYEEMSHMMESSWISLGVLQGEQCIVDNENENVKGDWVLPIIQKEMIYKKSIFQLKSKYIWKMMEGDLAIKDFVNMMWEELILLTRKNP